MAAQPTLTRLNHRHDAIIQWLLMYPDRLLCECAEYFGYTQAWLSRIIHTDMFQAAYQEQAEALGVATTHTIKAKMAATAALALDRAHDRIESGAASERFLGETMRTTLTALGYGASAAPVATVDARSVHFHMDAERIIAARESAAAAKAGLTPAKLAGPTTVDQVSRREMGLGSDEEGVSRVGASGGDDMPQLIDIVPEGDT